MTISWPYRTVVVTRKAGSVGTQHPTCVSLCTIRYARFAVRTMVSAAFLSCGRMYAVMHFGGRFRLDLSSSCPAWSVLPALPWVDLHLLSAWRCQMLDFTALGWRCCLVPCTRPACRPVETSWQNRTPEARRRACGLRSCVAATRPLGERCSSAIRNPAHSTGR